MPLNHQINEYPKKLVFENHNNNVDQRELNNRIKQTTSPESHSNNSGQNREIKYVFFYNYKMIIMKKEIDVDDDEYGFRLACIVVDERRICRIFCLLFFCLFSQQKFKPNKSTDTIMMV